MPPPTSCILVSLLRFPCGTLAATVLITRRWTTAFSRRAYSTFACFTCYLLTINALTVKKYKNRLKDVAVHCHHTNFWLVIGATPFYFHLPRLLNLLRFISHHFCPSCHRGLMFSTGCPADVARYATSHRKGYTPFIKNSIRLAIFWSSSTRLLSALPLKETWLEPPPHTIPSARRYTVQSVTCGFHSECCYAPRKPLLHWLALSRLMYSPFILLTRNPPFLFSKNFIHIRYKKDKLCLTCVFSGSEHYKYMKNIWKIKMFFKNLIIL